MDPLCHTLAGAALAEAGLKRTTALGTATLVLAANAPDIDVAVFATDTLAMSFRRGWTHGVLAMAVLPVALTAVMLLWDRVVRRPRAHGPPARPGALLLLAYIGTLSHPLLDYMNSYGVRLLMPFSNHWFYGDALYIIDPWMWGVLALGIVGAQWRARRAPEAGERVARVAVALVSLYVAVMWGSNLWARAVVRGGLERAGRAEARFMVTPVFGNPLQREVLVDTGGRYEKGFLWFDPLPRFRPAGYGVAVGLDEPLARAAAETDIARAFLSWSRFPFFVPDETVTPPRVFLNDYRYSGAGGRDGWATVVIPVPGTP